MTEARDWVSFWNAPHSIYVNARHFDAHYRDVADGIVALLPGANARVLDYGSGEAIHADKVAAHCGKLTLCESAENVRTSLTRRFGGNGKIEIVSPDEAARFADGSLDLIVANSVAQYLSGAALDALLAQWRRQLAPGGALVMADVIPPGISPLTDAFALLRYAARNGFLIAAFVGLARTVFSDYRKVRAKLGITTYSEDAFAAKLAAAGYKSERIANLEHNPARMSFLARPN